MRRTTTRWALGTAVAAAFAVLIVWPVVELGRVSAEQIASGHGSAVTWPSVRNTLLVGVAVSVLAVGLGLAAAALTERSDGFRWLRVGIVVPFLVPPFVAALSWIAAYGPTGLLHDLTGLEFPGLFGPVGVIVVVAVNAIPLAYVIVAAGFNTRVDHSAELAAKSSGASGPTTVRTITLPLLAPTILGAAALVFVLAINAFGVPAFLGTPARFETVTTRVYQDLAFSARPEAFGRAVLLASGLVVVAVSAVVAGERLLKGLGSDRRPLTAAGPSLPLVRRRPVVIGAAATLVVLTTIVPLVALVGVAITQAVGLAPTVDNWTLGHFAEALQPRLLGALGRSVLLAGVAATVTLALGAAVVALGRRRVGRLASTGILIGFAIPGSTLAVAMVLGYGRLLRDTLLLILLAYLAKLWAVSHRSVAGAAAHLPPDLAHAARASGAGPMTSLRTVTIPLLRPAIAAAWVLVFLVAFHELTMSALLYGPGTDTAAVAILNLQQLGDVPVTAALAVILTIPALLVAVPMLTVGAVSRRLLGVR